MRVLFVYVRDSGRSDPLLLFAVIFGFLPLLFKLKYGCIHSSTHYGSIQLILDFKNISSYLFPASEALTS